MAERVSERVSNVHQYLGGKKSKGDLFSLYMNIEPAIINQITTGIDRTSSRRHHEPKDFDKKLL